MEHKIILFKMKYKHKTIVLYNLFSNLRVTCTQIQLVQKHSNMAYH